MPLAVSIENMEACVRRELGFRRRVYPRWVAQTKLRAEDAAVEIERMEAILEALEELRLARAFLHEAVRGGVSFHVGSESGMPILGMTISPANGAGSTLLGAWEAWRAPREAPLTTGTHAA